MLIEAMPQVLRWEDCSEPLRQVHDSYLALLQDALAQFLRNTRVVDASLASSVAALTTTAPSHVLLRVLTSPEASARLLWPEDHQTTDIATFLDKSLKAELVLEGHLNVDRNEGTWNATGDAHIDADGSVYRMPSILDFPALDFGSPYAKQVDLSGADRPRIPDRPGFSDGEEALLVSRLVAVRNELQATSPFVARFVTDFNKVLVLQKDPETPSQFSSGSNGQYIGRSFLANPHLAGVDVEVLADAIVHEGIHALLYMQERRQHWVSDESISDGTPRIRSPWSGNGLPVRSFLQACFVWYGLLHFWCLALQAGTFASISVREMIVRSLRGFLSGSLSERTAQWHAAISTELIEAIDEMQNRVLVAFAPRRK